MGWVVNEPRVRVCIALIEYEWCFHGIFARCITVIEVTRRIHGCADIALDGSSIQWREYGIRMFPCK